MTKLLADPAWLRSFPRGLLPTALAALVLVATAAAAPAPEPAAPAPTFPPAAPPGAIRVATFNIFELSCKKIDERDAAGRYTNPQLENAAEILRRVRPQILLVNEIDYHPMENCAQSFYERYLRGPRNGLQGLDFPFVTYLPVNTGVPSGLDLNNDGDKNDGEDAWGFGEYPGQYGMALFSSFPIDAAAVRTFQNFKWKDQPGNLMPDGQGGRPAFYPPENAAQLRLSSKSHWDVPIEVRGHTLHVLASHPTPPVFDGPEDRNGRRNFDEIRLWADYLTGGQAAAWLIDDQGHQGGLAAGASFVILGDYNADPIKSDLVEGQKIRAIDQLLGHPRVQPLTPASPGDRPPRAKESSKRDLYPGDPKTRTSDYGRIDYVLPSRDLEVLGSGVFFPAEGDPLRQLVLGQNRASDHNLVWADLRLPR